MLQSCHGVATWCSGVVPGVAAMPQIAGFSGPSTGTGTGSDNAGRTRPTGCGISESSAQAANATTVQLRAELGDPARIVDGNERIGWNANPIFTAGANVTASASASGNLNLPVNAFRHGGSTAARQTRTLVSVVRISRHGRKAGGTTVTAPVSPPGPVPPEL